MTQCLRGGLAPFLLTDKDSTSDGVASPTKRKRRTIKSLEMSLASFTNEYLGILAEEKGSPTGEVMLRHLRNKNFVQFYPETMHYQL